MMKSSNKQSCTHELDLTKSDVEFLLYRWGTSTFGQYNIPWSLDERFPISFGKTNLYDENRQFVTIGAKEFSLFRRKPDDRSVVTMGVSLFHEFRHCRQNLGKNVDKSMMMSLLSTFGNDYYYLGNWTQMPYEIDAEYSGISNMRTALLDLCDEETVDKCMLDYVNFRSEHIAYFIPYSDEGYKTMDEVNKAFEKAYDDSILCKREAQPRLSKYPDEFSRLTRADEGAASPYYKYFDKFIEDMPGEKKDRMLAAAVFHLHPDLRYRYSELNFDDITFESEFGEPFPETTEESRNRLGIEDDTESIIKLTKVFDRDCFAGFDDLDNDEFLELLEI